MAQQERFKNIPSECKMPDLSDLKSLVGTLIVQEMLSAKSGLSQKTRLYRKNFIRLLNEALVEYQDARQCILNQIAEAKRPPEEMAKEGRIMYMLEFPNHMETCINATARLYKLLDGLNAKKEPPMLPRELRRLVETKKQPIKDIRGAVEHMDERIRNGKIDPGQPIMLALNGNHDGVVISDHEIKFKELAMVLRRLHEIAQYLLTVKKLNS